MSRCNYQIRSNVDIDYSRLPENDSKRPKYDHMDSYFSQLCSPAVRPCDFQAADLSGVTFSDLSVSQRAVRPEQRPRISPDLRPLMDYRDSECNLGGMCSFVFSR